ncbi:hypothetical protein IFM89_006576 [Coptis chinensis]|uniref:Uncharacterized protein n=1 Tax=Coptis chinensis TaxID=261450 RepID=A0A835MA37_9MAGN|nr:hypothetical protein IFM89_006576 [Coptis chinensis]
MNNGNLLEQKQRNFSIWMSRIMDMTTETMSDAIDDVVNDDEAEEETDDLTNEVLDEIGVEVATQLSATPKGSIAGKKTEDLMQ